MKVLIAVIVIATTVLAIGTALISGYARGQERGSTGDIVMMDTPNVLAPATDRYAAALRDYVDDEGMADYAGLQANPGDLNAYLTSVANLDPEAFNDWSDAERIALWCNAYNAYTLKAIIDHYPIKASFFRSLTQPKNSIRQINGVWDKLRWPVMGDRITLDTIEHEILRVDFDEPRIHAALVCAAKSCPPLRNEPYEGDRLDQQLDDQMRAFLTDANRFRVDRESNIVYLSSILKWYGEDFVKSYTVEDGFGGHGPVERAVLNAIAPHVTAEDADYLSTAQYELDYLEYDWSLNEQT